MWNFLIDDERFVCFSIHQISSNKCVREKLFSSWTHAYVKKWEWMERIWRYDEVISLHVFIFYMFNEHIRVDVIIIARAKFALWRRTDSAIREGNFQKFLDRHSSSCQNISDRYMLNLTASESERLRNCHQQNRVDERQLKKFNQVVVMFSNTFLWSPHRRWFYVRN